MAAPDHNADPRRRNRDVGRARLHGRSAWDDLRLRRTDGETLWQGNLGLAASTPLEIYSIDGQEYVLGSIGGSALTIGPTTPPLGSELVALKLDGRPLRGS